MTQAALAGAHVATIPFKVLQQMVHHPLTDKGIVQFRADWEKARNGAAKASSDRAKARRRPRPAPRTRSRRARLGGPEVVVSSTRSARWPAAIRPRSVDAEHLERVPARRRDGGGSDEPWRTRLRTAVSRAMTDPASVDVPRACSALETSISRPPIVTRPSPIPAIAARRRRGSAGRPASSAGRSARAPGRRGGRRRSARRRRRRGSAPRPRRPARDARCRSSR